MSQVAAYWISKQNIAKLTWNYRQSMIIDHQDVKSQAFGLIFHFFPRDDTWIKDFHGF